MIKFMKNLIKKIGAFLKRLTGKAFEVLRANASLAVTVTAKLKDLVESNAVGTIVDLIPGEGDDRALAMLRKVLPVVSEKLAVLFGALSASEKNADAVALIIEKLRSVNPEARAPFWLAFSAELNSALSDGKISLAEAAALAQMIYVEQKALKS